MSIDPMVAINRRRLNGLEDDTPGYVPTTTVDMNYFLYNWYPPPQAHGRIKPRIGVPDREISFGTEDVLRRYP